MGGRCSETGVGRGQNGGEGLAEVSSTVSYALHRAATPKQDWVVRL